MKEEIYRNIIKNSKIAYLIIDCKKNYHNKYTSIEVIEQSKEFEKVFKILTKNNILDSDITELIINNWINYEYHFLQQSLQISHKYHAISNDQMQFLTDKY